MIKKIITASLLASLLLMSFTGCNNENEDVTKDSDVSVGDEDTAKVPDASAESRTYDEALVIANEILQKIADGENFDDLVAQYNEDGMIETGYLVYPGRMVEAFEEESYALGINEISAEPVKTEFGYHILQRLEADEAFYNNTKDKLIYPFMYEKFNEKFLKNYEEVNVELSDVYENISATNFADYLETSDIIKLNGEFIPTDMFIYMFSGFTAQADNGDLTFWDKEENDEAHELYKSEALNFCKQTVAMEKTCKDIGFELSPELQATYDDSIKETIESEGGDVAYQQSLKEANLSEETLNRISLVSFKSQAISETFTTLSDEYTPQDVIDWLNDTEISGAVRVKHILILGKDEPEAPESDEVDTDDVDTDTDDVDADDVDADDVDNTVDEK